MKSPGKSLISFAIGVTILAGASPAFASSVFNDYLSTRSDSIDYVTDTADGYNTSSSIGRTGTSNSQISFRYVPGSSHNVCSVTLSLVAVGSPTDAVFMNVAYYGLDSGTGGPTLGSTMSTQGKIIANATTGYQVRDTTNGAAYTFSFDPCLVVVGANRYNFNLYRSGFLDNTNYYEYGSMSVSNGGYSQSGSWDISKQLTYRGWSSTGVTNTYPGEGVFPLIVFSGTENFGAIAASTSASFSQTVINKILGINDNNATSSLSTGETGLNIFTGIPGYFAERVPFGYFWSIKDLFTNAATSSQDFGTLQFDFSSASISTSTRSYLPGKITVLSTSTVTYYLTPGLLVAINSVISASLMVSWLIWAFYRIKGVVIPV